MKTLAKLIKPALLTVALTGFFVVANGAWAQNTANILNQVNTAQNANAQAIYSSSAQMGTNSDAGNRVIQQVYNIIRFAYIFFYAIAVLLVAQAWLKYKEQKYDAMFASMGAALGLFLTPALIDFIHGLGRATATGV